MYIQWGGLGQQVNRRSVRQGATWLSCRSGCVGNLSFFPVADHDTAGNIYVAYTDGGDRHTYLITVPVTAFLNPNKCNHPAASGQPTNNPGSSPPLQVDRDAVRSTVFAWLAAGGVPGRVAVTFYGTPTEGNPDLVPFNARACYFNQSVNALDWQPTSSGAGDHHRSTTTDLLVVRLRSLRSGAIACSPPSSASPQTGSTESSPSSSPHEQEA